MALCFPGRDQDEPGTRAGGALWRTICMTATIGTCSGSASRTRASICALWPPPFNSQASYNVQCHEPPRERSPAHIAAFADNTPRAKLLENATNIILSGQNRLI